MRKQNKIVVISWEIVALGILSLLNAMHVLPGVNWLTTIGPATVGIAILLMYGSSAFTQVLCPFLVFFGAFRFVVLAFMDPGGRLQADVRIPIYIIVLGILLLRVSLKRAAERAAGSQKS